MNFKEKVLEITSSASSSMATQLVVLQEKIVPLQIIIHIINFNKCLKLPNIYIGTIKK